MTEHTPAPWEVSRAPLTRQLCVMSPTTWICGQLQSDNETRVDTSECVANARLIAAAPDLLEACASVWLMLSGTKDNELRLIADECRAAIDKATSAHASETST